MYNLDTNVLIRAYLEDDLLQSQKAQKLLQLLAKENQIFISSYALLEFVWVLKVKKFMRQQIYTAIISLTDASGVTVGQRHIVLTAAEKYLKGNADFGDYMIIAEGEYNSSHHIKTFDQAILNEVNASSRP